MTDVAAACVLCWHPLLVPSCVSVVMWIRPAHYSGGDWYEFAANNTAGNGGTPSGETNQAADAIKLPDKYIKLKSRARLTPVA